MATLNDVMNEKQFHAAKELAIRITRSMDGEQYTTAQLMLAAAMFVAGIIQKDVQSEHLLKASSDFLGELLRTSIEALHKAQENEPDETVFAHMPVSSRTN